MLRFIRDLLAGWTNKSISQWFTVEFDAEVVRLNAAPPGRDPWAQEFCWSDVERVCFKAEDLGVSDGIYVFTRQRAESFAIPTEATGGSEFWGEILARGLFDAELAITAASSPGGTFVWPPESD